MIQDESIANVDRPTHKRVQWRSWLPSRGSVLLVFMVAGALLLYVRTAGAVPGAAPAAASTSVIPYQGRLADSSGHPLNGSYAMTFKLYNLASGGSALWVESWSGGNNVVVTSGLFNVLLGSLTPIPPNVFATYSSLWLGVTVGSDSEMAPRVQLGTVPFAAQAMTVADGSITLAKIANDASEPDRTASWTFGPMTSFNASGASATQITLTTDITLSVPTGKAYYYWVNYNAIFRYEYGERIPANTAFYGEWNAALVGGNTRISLPVEVVSTGYREDWANIGGTSYWNIPMDANWLIRLTSGVYPLKVQIIGYSDSTMNTAHVFTNSLQVVRIP